MPLNDYDKDLVQAMFRDDCNVPTVRKVVPHATTSTLNRIEGDVDLIGAVWKPVPARKWMEASRKITL